MNSITDDMLGEIFLYSVMEINYVLQNLMYHPVYIDSIMLVCKKWRYLFRKLIRQWLSQSKIDFTIFGDHYSEYSFFRKLTDKYNKLKENKTMNSLEIKIYPFAGMVVKNW
jgi:hypothetical protein